MPAQRSIYKLQKITTALLNLYDIIASHKETEHSFDTSYFSTKLQKYYNENYKVLDGDESFHWEITYNKIGEVVNKTIDELLTIDHEYNPTKEMNYGYQFVDRYCSNEDGLYSFNGDGKMFISNLLVRCETDLNEVYIPKRLNVIELIRKMFERALLLYDENPRTHRDDGNGSIWEKCKEENKQIIKRRYGHRLFEGKINEFICSLPTRPTYTVWTYEGGWKTNRTGLWDLGSYHQTHGDLETPFDMTDLRHNDVCFGVEWECNCPSHKHYSEFLSSFVKDGIIGPKVNTLKFFCEDDGSLCGDYTFEVIGCPMSYENSLKWWKEFQERAKKFDIESSYEDNSAGIHIHISRDWFKDDEEIYRFSKIFFDCPMKIYKKWFGRGESSYCHKTMRMQAEWVKHTNGKHYIDLVRDRYVCVNLGNDETIEVRCFNANTNIVVDIKLIKIIMDTVRSYDGKEFDLIKAIKDIDDKFENIGE